VAAVLTVGRFIPIEQTPAGASWYWPTRMAAVYLIYLTGL
jgi:hypothetical protein